MSKIVCKSKTGSPLDPDVEKAIVAVYSSEQTDLVGDIVPPAWHTTLPRKGRRTPQSYVNIFVLAHIVSWHRPKVNWEGDTAILTQKFSGRTFILNRTALARQLDCDIDDISAALTWAEENGFVRKTSEAHRSTDGEYLGTTTYVTPVVDEILKYSGTPLMAAPVKADPNPSDGGTRQARPEPASGPTQTPSSSTLTPLKGACIPNADPNPVPKTKLKQQQEGTTANASGEAVPPENNPGAAPQTPCVVSASQSGAVAPEPPLDLNKTQNLETETNLENLDRDRFIAFYLGWYDIMKGKKLTQISKQELEALTKLFQENLNALYVSIIWLRCQQIAQGEYEDEHNGYTYPSCLSAENSLQKFCQYFDRIEKDVQSCFPSDKVKKLADCIYHIIFRIKEETNSTKSGEDFCHKHFPEEYQAYRDRYYPTRSEPIQDPPRTKAQNVVTDPVLLSQHNKLSDRCRELKMKSLPFAGGNNIPLMEEIIREKELKLARDKQEQEARAKSVEQAQNTHDQVNKRLDQKIKANPATSPMAEQPSQEPSPEMDASYQRRSKEQECAKKAKRLESQIAALPLDERGLKTRQLYAAPGRPHDPRKEAGGHDDTPAAVNTALAAGMTAERSEPLDSMVERGSIPPLQDRLTFAWQSLMTELTGQSNRQKVSDRVAAEFAEASERFGAVEAVGLAILAHTSQAKVLPTDPNQLCPSRTFDIAKHIRDEGGPTRAFLVEGIQSALKYIKDDQEAVARNRAATKAHFEARESQRRNPGEPRRGRSQDQEPARVIAQRDLGGDRKVEPEEETITPSPRCRGSQEAV